MSGHDFTVEAIWTSMSGADLAITCSCGQWERVWEDGGHVPLPELAALAAEHAPASPWIPADPDGLPPRTYPAWRAQEAARRGLEAT